MVRTARDALVTALENLEKKGLKKFRNKLNDWPIKDGFSKIPRGQLEDKCPDDVANKIRDFYTFPYGIQVALAVLEAIDEKEVALGLCADLRNVDGFVFEQQREGTDPGATCKVTPPLPEPTREHFVIEHRGALISRMSLVDPVLDTLLQKKLLTDEQNDVVQNKPTSQEKMRELYRHVRSWGDTDKDIFYEALKKHNAPLIRDLERA
ncbi:apoptosis-associated speck-like protein containing a CARD [Pseudophryne corroboree]|uniref:apoptosis-associated speck-like protein containing a CARD n=1 Tax=Pseudophryne corroboree TaxID=495146 RepID=UPI0030813478